MTEYELLDTLEEDEEQQRPKEELLLPEVELSHADKISTILQGSFTHLTYDRLKGRDFTDNLLAYYLVQNLDTSQVNNYLGNYGDEDTIRKLLFVDLAYGITGKSEYSLDISVEKLAITISGDIYHDLFEKLSDIVYLNPMDNIMEDLPEDAPEEEGGMNGNNHEEIFQFFKGRNVETSIAAAQFLPYLDGLEERIPSISEVKELKQLMALKIYHDLLRSDDLKVELRNHVNNPAYSLDNVLNFSVLQLHRDMLKAMGS